MLFRILWREFVFNRCSVGIHERQISAARVDLKIRVQRGARHAPILA
jgi:hypothetical protein